jgi:alpha-methylacyl-CoA racemase
MGPLHGTKVVELAGIGPAPFAGMALADMGADVILVERLSKKSSDKSSALPDCSRRGKQSLALDIKSTAGQDILHQLIAKADVLLEGFRPGVMERLGAGPDICLQNNPALVYARMTGWGQTGPLSQAAGHDINYISLTGALAAIGEKDKKPVVPLNLVGDFGGGGMLVVNGILAALLERGRSGKGQVVDAAMTDGSAYLMSFMHSMTAQGMWQQQRASNMLDGGAPYYNTYETSDGRYISIGSIEPQFYALLKQHAELDESLFGNQHDPALWPQQAAELKRVFLSKTQQQWCDIMQGTDVCFAPILNLEEAPSHPHNVARETYIEVGGMTQPAPAPRFSRTPSAVQFESQAVGKQSVEVLQALGLSSDQIDQLVTDAIVGT